MAEARTHRLNARVRANLDKLPVSGCDSSLLPAFVGGQGRAGPRDLLGWSVADEAVVV